MLSNIVESISYNVNNTLFGGYGVGGKRSIKNSESEVNSYFSRLEGGEHPSAKVEYWIPDHFRRLEENSSSESIRNRYSARALSGYRCACHVFAYLSGVEASFGEYWNYEKRICANAICAHFQLPPIYVDSDVSNVKLKLSDFDVHGPKSRLIITEEILSKAYDKFPVKGLYKDASNKNIEEEEKNTSSANDTTEKFTDDDVEVINVEAEVVEATKPKEKASELLLTESGLPKPEKTLDSLIFSKDNIDAVKVFIDYLKNKIDEFSAESEHPVDSNEDDNTIDVESIETKQEKEPVEEQPVEEEKTAEPAVEEQKGPEIPIKTLLNNDNLVLFPENGANKLPPKQEEKFMRIYGEYLQGKNFELHRLQGGYIECVIWLSNGGYISHNIDPGLMIGDDYYLAASVVVGDPIAPIFGTIMVHPSEKDIVYKVFNTMDRQYILTPDEFQRALSHLFFNQRIYSVVDMSNMGDRITKLKKNPEDFKKLGQKLTYIINLLDGTPMFGRMRFSKWNGVDNFELSSNEDKKNKIRSPFPQFTLEYKSGVVVQVTGDDVLVQFNGNSQKFTIDNYGVL
jgi:hypothetical protein